MISSKKKNKWRIQWLAMAAFLPALACHAQISQVQLQHFIADSKQPAEIQKFYTSNNFKTAWIQKENSGNRNTLLRILAQSADMGLYEQDYQPAYLASLNNGTLLLRDAADSMQAELRVTGNALHFFNDLAYGNAKPGFGYFGLPYSPACENTAGLLAESISRNKLQDLAGRLSPPLPEIPVIEARIRWFNNIISDSNFHEVTITSKKVSFSNTALISRLYQLGVIGSANAKLPDSLVKQKLKEAQRLFGLLPDAVLRSTILQELNIPLSVRRQQLNLAVNHYRWLYCLLQNRSVIVVNIPAAYMKVYHDSNTILQMRMIVGKRSTPTPTLASTVSEVVLYPYWHVPYSIATKELLPSIKRNPGFIDAGNYQVLNKAGKIVDPHSVNWHAYSAAYFPFTIRQSTGCDNALGLLKLNFYSPFGVYLHDTPGKNLFMLNKRYFSHGCMRMEKPMELGHLVLRNNAIAIDTLEQKGCLRNQAPITVPADVQMPVIVWYNPAGIDNNGRLLFYEDVYGKLEGMKRE